jgi:hypothetical protein
MSPNIAKDNIKRIGNLTSIKAAGTKMGMSCAKNIRTRPDLGPLFVMAFFLSKAQPVIDEFRRTGDLNDAGEAAFREGFYGGIFEVRKTL